MLPNNTQILSYQFIDKLKKLAFVDSIYLYGSRARGDNTETSDIDLAIKCPAATEDDWLKVMDVIEDADTLLKIDCVRLDEVDEELKKNVYLEGKKLYERNKN